MLLIIAQPCVFDSLACSWHMFPAVGLPYSALIGWLLLCLIISCFVTFGCCLLEICSSVKGNTGEGEQTRGELEGSGRSGGGKTVGWIY